MKQTPDALHRPVFAGYVVGFCALAGFILSLAVHIAAVFGVDASARFPWVWSLHFGVFLVFIPFVISSRKTFKGKPSLAEARQLFPGWVLALGAVIFVYVAINFILLILATEGGSPSIMDGRFVLQNHGKWIRDITAAQYNALQASVMRGFSGHWLTFYYLPLAYFLLRRPKD